MGSSVYGDVCLVPLVALRLWRVESFRYASQNSASGLCIDSFAFVGGYVFFRRLPIFHVGRIDRAEFLNMDTVFHGLPAFLPAIDDKEVTPLGYLTLVFVDFHVTYSGYLYGGIFR